MRTSKPIVILLVTTMLASCADQKGDGMSASEGVGTVAGAVAGGLIGSSFGGGSGETIATVGGALLGAFLGNRLGDSMDADSVGAYDRAAQQALETGQPQSWRNSATGESGTIIPARSYVNTTGQTCRNYTQSVYLNNQRYDNHGTACLGTDGVWRVVATQ